MSVQNFKIKHGLNLGDHELIDVSGNINLPTGAVINIDNQPLDALPDQTNQTGKFLSTDGSSASWNAITQYTPPTNQGGGNFLSGDGTYKQVTVPSLVSELTNDSGYQTGAQVASSIAALVDTAPSTLNTLNELAAALSNDPNFATTTANQIGTKWTQDSAKLSQWDAAYGWGNHAAAGYANQSDTEYQLTFKAPLTYVNDNLALKADQSTTYTKTETDTALALKADLSGGTFTGTVKSELGVLNPTIVPVGKTLTIPSGYQMVVDQIDVQGELDVQGTLATTTGGSLSQTTMKTQVIQNPVQGSGLTINENTSIGSNAATRSKLSVTRTTAEGGSNGHVIIDINRTGTTSLGHGSGILMTTDYAGSTGVYVGANGLGEYGIYTTTDNSVNNIKKFAITQTGAMQVPLQPAFQYSASTNQEPSSATIIVYDTVIKNVGNSYVGSSSKFTAPVAGWYEFTWRYWFRQSTSGTINCEILKNGIGIQQYRTSRPTAAADFETIIRTFRLYLDKDDYVQPSANGGAGTCFHSSTGAYYSEWSGILLS